MTAATSSPTGTAPRNATMPDLRFDPLRREWVAYATERNDRTFLPTDFCPLCPSGPGGSSEIPLDTFDAVVFENRFPAFGPVELSAPLRHRKEFPQLNWIPCRELVLKDA